MLSNTPLLGYTFANKSRSWESWKTLFIIYFNNRGRGLGSSNNMAGQSSHLFNVITCRGGFLGVFLYCHYMPPFDNFSVIIPYHRKVNKYFGVSAFLSSFREEKMELTEQMPCGRLKMLRYYYVENGLKNLSRKERTKGQSLCKSTYIYRRQCSYTILK